MSDARRGPVRRHRGNHDRIARESGRLRYPPVDETKRAEPDPVLDDEQADRAIVDGGARDVDDALDALTRGRAESRGKPSSDPPDGGE
ncbi:MAG: hypothetical protein RID91_16110 [Azospirillaceae bacterium]